MTSNTLKPRKRQFTVARLNMVPCLRRSAYLATNSLTEKPRSWVLKKNFWGGGPRGFFFSLRRRYGRLLNVSDRQPARNSSQATGWEQMA